MADETIQVKDRNGKVVPIYKKNLAEAIKRGATPVTPEVTKPPQEESVLKQSGREAALGAFSGLGIPESTEPIKDLLGNLKEQAAKMFVRPYTNPGAKSLKEMIEVNPAVAVPKGLVNTAQETAKSAGVRNMNLGPGVDVPFAGGAVDFPKFAHDMASLLTQIGLLKGGKKAAETPLAESEVVQGGKAVGKAAVEAPPKIVQSATGAKYAVNKAETAAQRAAQEKLDAYEKSVEDTKAATTRELAASRSKHVSDTAEQVGETKKLAAEYKKNLDEKARTEAENAKNEATKQQLSKQVEGNTKQLTQNLKQTLDNAKANFDKEYGDFDRQVLGKSEANPKGTLQAQLSPVAEAVQNAKKNIIEGTDESIKQFQSILTQKTKDYVDIGGGDVAPVAGQTIPAADLRGYITELESKLYDSNLLPDVKKGIRSVVDSAKGELISAIEDVHGSKAVSAYKDLNSRYSDYLTDWRDISSTNPLPRVRRILLEGVTKNNPNYPAHLDVARILKGANAQKAMVLLEKYRNFGADPKILADYNKALQQLDELPKPKKVPEVKKPQYPEAAKSVPVKFPKAPEAPKTQPFDRQTMMRNTIEERLNMAGKIGQGFKLLKLVSDAIHMNPGGAMSEAEQMAVIEAVRRAMTSDKALNYFSKEAP